jgi:glutamine synthetase
MTVPKDYADIEKIIAEQHIEMVDLKYSDLFGGWRHVTLPASHAGTEVLEKGIGFDSSSLPGFKTVESGDMCLLPDPATAFMDPFWEKPTLSLICDIVEADTRKPFSRDPRGIAGKAEEFLKSTGIADRSFWGPEFEYHIFDPADSDLATPALTGEIIQRNNSAGKPAKSGYHAVPPFDRFFNLRSETASLLEEAGIEVRYHHHEVGASSQQEIEVLLGPLTRMGDVAMMVKYFVKMTALKHGLRATFMPKPIFAEAGSGMHFHQHLFRDGEPLFYDRDGYAGLSETALSYVAGILLHAPALLGLTNPSTNSYKRLVPGYEAPVNLFFSLANRSAAVRVPKYAEEPDEKRIEFRPPDATCNPYLAMAAMLLAGIDGIKNRLDPSKLGFGPYDQNLFLPENEAILKSIKSLPASLDSALNALQEDHRFLTEGNVFTEDLLQTWVDTKMTGEFLDVRNRPHPREFDLYFDC